MTPLTADDPPVHVLSSHHSSNTIKLHLTFYLLSPPHITSPSSRSCTCQTSMRSSLTQYLIWSYSDRGAWLQRHSSFDPSSCTASHHLSNPALGLLPQSHQRSCSRFSDFVLLLCTICRSFALRVLIFSVPALKRKCSRPPLSIPHPPVAAFVPALLPGVLLQPLLLRFYGVVSVPALLWPWCVHRLFL